MNERGNDPLNGTTIDGRYLVRRRLARGGMSTVYLATDVRLHRDVALKILHPHLAEDPAFVHRFESEAITAAKLSHPHVVAVLDQGVDGDTAYLVMEYVPGRTLRDLLRERGRLAPRQALALLDPIVDGLAAAHTAGLVHRDMKPENVLLADDGRVKVADFGLARASANHTSTGALIGTVAYISPELVRGSAADVRSDIYAVGIMLFEMLTGRQPFTAEVPIQVAFQHVNSKVPAPSTLLPGLAPDLDELVEFCTQKEPEDRPNDATALLGELRHIRATLTDEQLDLGAAGFSALPQDPGTGTAAFPSADDATRSMAPAPGPAETTVIPGPSRTSVISGTRPAPARPPRTAAEGDGHDDGAGPPQSPRAAARTAKREAKAAQKDWAREAQKPLETLRTGRSARGGWVLGILLFLAAALLAVAGWFFGLGPGAPVNVPSLGGWTAFEASQELASLGVDSHRRDVFDDKLAPGLVVGTDPAAGTGIRRYETVELLVSKGPELFAVPNIVGRSEAAAATVLEDAQLAVGEASRAYNESVEQGLVVSQSPAPDKEVRRGTKVSYVVSRGPAPVQVPDVAGLPVKEARDILKAAGLVGRESGKDYSSTVPKGSVLSQSPASGTAERGSTVTYVVSRGPLMVQVPDVVGLQLDEARRQLEDLGFTVEVEKVLGGFFGTVRAQEPARGKAPEGSTVLLQVV